VKNIIGKVVKAGSRMLIITERGTSFGYNNLVVDMRSFGIMRKFGFPVVYDATHSLQHPGGAGGGGKISGGNSEFAPLLARAAVAAGIDGIFLEVHDDPSKALSDPATVLDIRKLEALIEKLKAIDALVDKK
jgi:2-dehydro-3-deoxyphosphooctonate aldolase (KDO 8-P synthase)